MEDLAIADRMTTPICNVSAPCVPFFFRPFFGRFKR